MLNITVLNIYMPTCRFPSHGQAICGSCSKLLHA